MLRGHRSPIDDASIFSIPNWLPDDVEYGTFISTAYHDIDDVALRQTQHLVSRFMLQILQGCGNKECQNSACYTYRRRVAIKPLRGMTELSARAMAMHLASEDNPELYLCKKWTGPALRTNEESPNIRVVNRDGSVFTKVMRPLNDADKDSAPTSSNLSPGNAVSAVPEAEEHHESSKRKKKDVKAFPQVVFDWPELKSLANAHQSIGPIQSGPRLKHLREDTMDNLDRMFLELSRLSDWLSPISQAATRADFSRFLRRSCYNIFGSREAMLKSFRFPYVNNMSDLKVPNLLTLEFDPSELSSTMEWWHAAAGPGLLEALCIGLESFDLGAIESGVETPTSPHYCESVHVMVIAIVGLVTMPLDSGGILVAKKRRAAAVCDVTELDSYPIALRLATRMVRIIVRCFVPARKHNPDELPHHHRKSHKFAGRLFWYSLHAMDKIWPVLPYLRLWVRRVFMYTWDGRAVMPKECDAAKALLVLDWLYPQEPGALGMTKDSIWQIDSSAPYTRQERKSAESWSFEAINDALDPLDMATTWIFRPSKTTHIHILDFGFIFDDSFLIYCFRALCFVRMENAVDVADLTSRIYSNRTVSSPLSFEQSMCLLRTASSKFLDIQVSRTNVVQDTFDLLWRREKRELLRPVKVVITHDGEEGIDEGGVAQEFFRIFFEQSCDPAYGLFTVDERTRMMWFNPSCMEPLWRYEMLGMVAALAVYNGFTTPFTFPMALYAKLLGNNSTDLDMILDGWEDLWSAFYSLLNWKEGDVGDVFVRTYEFAFEHYGKVISVDISKLPKEPLSLAKLLEQTAEQPEEESALVTNENRERYVKRYIFWLLHHSVQAQFEAFARGFYIILDPEMLQPLLPGVLARLVEGHNEIEVEELYKSTRYEGYTAESPIMQQFWAMVRNYSQDELKRLLEFVTASDRVPVNGMESIEFVIQRNGPDSEHLPSSSTCFGRLLLPEYSDEAKLKRKMGIALENFVGFGNR